jgi:hypothetical protein
VVPTTSVMRRPVAVLVAAVLLVVLWLLVEAP